MRLGISHVPADPAAAVLVERDLVDLMTDSTRRVLGPPRRQPIDQAGDERSIRGTRRLDATLRYWSEQSRLLPLPPCAMTMPAWWTDSCTMNAYRYAHYDAQRQPGHEPVRVTIVRLVPRLEVELSCDPRLMSPATMAELLHSAERVLLAASGSGVPLADLAALTRIRPVARGPEWTCIEGSWIDVGTVRRRLVEGELRHGVARMFTVPDGAERTLIAYLTSRDEVNIGELHPACVARLGPEEHGVMTPQWYVVVASPPDDQDASRTRAREASCGKAPGERICPPSPARWRRLDQCAGPRSRVSRRPAEGVGMMMEFQADPSASSQAEGDGLLTERLVAIWQEVLGTDDISRDAHFYDLGGRSIAVVGLVMRLAEEFGTDVPIDEILEAPTIAGQVALIARKTSGMLLDDSGHEVAEPGMLHKRPEADPA
ncbi:acyl carrier protein [Nonomuraea sp. JJY05]|uniref:acyl carrier protein n=1 Tax=Nonomuraea sp. JJY05 TaxID=3350255 RepID=UPI00373FADCF